jgi:hemolysin activation/secretion protein
MSAGVSGNSPLYFGDQISFTGTGSGGLTLGRANYSFPINAFGTRLDIGYLMMAYEDRTDLGKAAGLKGESRSATVRITHPWQRSQNSNIYMNFLFHHKKFNDEAGGFTIRDKRNRAGTFQLSGDRLDNRWGGGLISWQAGLATGVLRLKEPEDAAADAASFHTAGSFQKLTGSLSRIQNLNGPFSVYGGLSGQWADGNLDSSEKFYLGGPYGVRAYPGSEAGGDHAALLNLEGRFDLPNPTPVGLLQVQVFYDLGWVQLHDDQKGQPINTISGKNNYTISGAGIGLSLTRAGRYQFKAAWATTVGSNPGRDLNGNNSDGQDDRHRFWLQGVVWF